MWADDVIFWGAWVLALIAGAAWYAIASEIGAERRKNQARRLVNGALHKMENGRSALYAGAELQFRADKLGCTREVRILWDEVEKQLDDEDRP
ncbi:MAG: hypothetical protein E6Q97_03255 [Desulfurellales bacterium]|nr:MAG: hypothetical protein E6Q97_03255 [Desulfurellales bacterium]